MRVPSTFSGEPCADCGQASLSPRDRAGRCVDCHEPGGARGVMWFRDSRGAWQSMRVRLCGGEI